MENSLQPWDRQPGEGARPYQAFTIYCGLGPQRSLQKTAEQCGKALSTLKKWSVQHQWTQRAVAFDNEQTRLLFESKRRKHIEKLESYHQATISTTKTLQAMSLRCLKKLSARLEEMDQNDLELLRPDQIFLSLKHLSQILKFSLDLEAQVLGVAELMEHFDLANSDWYCEQYE